MDGRVDRGTVVTTFLLLLYGLVMVYSASAPFSLRHYGSDTYLLFKQLIAAGIGVAGLVLLAHFDYHRLRYLDDILLFGAFALTVLTVLPLPGVSDGRWLHLGAFALQPTELLKFALIVYLAATIERKGERIRSFSEGVLPFIIVLLVLAAVVINQPDLGMILIFGALTMVMLFLGGARLPHLITVASLSLPLIYLAVLIAPYRMARVLSFLNRVHTVPPRGIRSCSLSWRSDREGSSGAGWERRTPNCSTCHRRTTTSSSRSPRRSWG